jgi:hypothetical protein
MVTWATGIIKRLSGWVCFFSSVFRCSLNTLLGVSFLRKMKMAVEEKADHVEAHELLTPTVPPEAIVEWTKAVEDWEADAKAKNPYEVRVSRAYIGLQL